MRIGVIGSKGGAALASAVDCLQEAGKSVDVFVLADRDCGMLRWAQERQFGANRCNYVDPESFSSNALKAFRENGVEQILMFYSRRVCHPLIGALPVYNVHPALLPAFRGLHGVEDAIRAGVRILGATIHGVDEGLDTGPIVAQIATALPLESTPAFVNKMSFLQKVYLTLVWYELIHNCGVRVDVQSRLITYDRFPPVGLAMSPAIEDPALALAFDRLQKNENCRVVAHH